MLCQCLYLADVIGVRAEQLLQEFKDSVCPCLGCCGGESDMSTMLQTYCTLTRAFAAFIPVADKQCYFPNVEEKWMR